MRLWKKALPARTISAGKGYDLQQLKILIVSTAKTGNTWLRHLLSTIYDLPAVDLPLHFDRTAINQLGDRWIGHQHYHPQSDLLAWAKQHNVVLLTTVRHPADVLISLYHHVRSHPDVTDYGVEAVLIAKNADTAEQKLATFVEGFFYVVLNTSIAWIYSDTSQIIRYEHLWRDPVTTLVEVTERISPVTLDRIERAVEQCDISMMRKVSGSVRSFFRQGGVGGWRKELSAEVIDLFRRHDPYPAQFKALGYTLDPTDPLIDALAVPRPEKNPFHQTGRFDNGVPAPPIVVRLYLSFDSADARGRWPDPTATQSPGSFYAWLNAPTALDTRRKATEPIITNLSAYLHQVASTFGEVPSEIYGRGRADWAFWLIQNARKEYDLDIALMQALHAWATAPAPDDHIRDESMPQIANLIAYIYRTRPDVRTEYPDLYDRNRIGYMIWFFQYGANEYRLDPAYTRPLLERFLAWANAPDPADPHRHEPGPYVSRLAAYVYHKRADLQKMFPDLYDQHRLDYLTWFVDNHAGFAGLVRSVVLAWAQGCRQVQSDLSQSN